VIIFDNKVYNKKKLQQNKMDFDRSCGFIRFCSQTGQMSISYELPHICRICGHGRMHVGLRTLTCYYTDEPKCLGIAFAISDLKILYDTLRLAENSRVSLLSVALQGFKRRQEYETRTSTQLVLTGRPYFISQLCTFLEPPIMHANLAVRVLTYHPKVANITVGAAILSGQEISTRSAHADVSHADVAHADVAHVDVAHAGGSCRDADGIEYHYSKLTEGENKVIGLILPTFFYILKENGGDFDGAIAKMHNMHCIFDHDDNRSPHDNLGPKANDGDW
jgi:hypothetical protein